MTERIPSMLLATLLAFASHGAAAQTAVPDADGFTRPMERLRFNPQLNQREFERATLVALVNNDPWEEWNRRVYHFNQRFDEWVYLPVVDAYRFVTPRAVRSGVSHFFANLGEIPSLTNHLLQLQGRDALHTTARLLLNTTLGLGGLWDPASRMGLARRSEDFGQTLGYWGVEEGPYLVLPLLGPSNLRDTGGLAFDTALGNTFDPAGATGLSAQATPYYGLMAVDRRYINAFRYGQLNSPFEYEKVRYVYTEARRLQIAE